MAKKRKNKTSKPVKEFFESYHKVKAKRKQLLAETLGRDVTVEEANKLYAMEEYLKLIEEMLELFPGVQQDIMKKIYIDRMSQRKVAMELNYAYTHLNDIKVKGDAKLQEVLVGDLFKWNELIGKITDSSK